MRIMGIDFGDKRTGVSISDLNAVLAGESFIITEPDSASTVDKIVEIAKDREVSEIVVGLPKNMNGTIGVRGLKSVVFAERLRERTSVNVVLWDERLTTVDANRILTETGNLGKKRKEKTDAVAASLILQSYLDYKAGKNHP
ncbi:MAG: Holliday junction resolvase RuvX [Clostridiales bacterium]|jgi:putative Holliday junction resolvase|nr:Holliday junction resolvase RuvX [Clostridiales bacterium]